MPYLRTKHKLKLTLGKRKQYKCFHLTDSGSAFYYIADIQPYLFNIFNSCTYKSLKAVALVHIYSVTLWTIICGKLHWSQQDLVLTKHA